MLSSPLFMSVFMYLSFYIYSASSLDGPRGRAGGPAGPGRPVRGAGPVLFFKKPSKGSMSSIGA